MKTSTIPVSAPAWHIVDAEGQTLGRIATKIATVLRGKHKASFSPHQLCGDHVVVINAGKMKVDPKKLDAKLYRKHTGYLGHMKVSSLGQKMESDPTEVITIAVKRMLPGNRLRAQILKRLHVYADVEHPHAAQQPSILSCSKSQIPNDK